jgi:hypothetical protein
MGAWRVYWGMLRTILTLGTIALTALGAHAQDTDKLEKKLEKMGDKIEKRVMRALDLDDEAGVRQKHWRLQLGIARPTTSTGRNFLGTSPGVGGLGYDLGRVGKNGVWGFYADGFGRSKETSNVTTTEDVAGVGLQVRFHTGSGVYYGGGIGQYSLSLGTSQTLGNTTTSFVSSEDRFGGKVFVGKPFGSRYFAEAGYTMVGSKRVGTRTAEGSNLSLTVGVRL